MKINKLLTSLKGDDPLYTPLHIRIHKRIAIELERQKAEGKVFLTNKEIDDLIDRVMHNEIDNPTK